MAAYYGQVIRQEGAQQQKVAAVVITTYPVDDKGEICLDSNNVANWRTTWANPGFETTCHSPVCAANHTQNFSTESAAREAAIHAVERHYTTREATVTVALD